MDQQFLASQGNMLRMDQSEAALFSSTAQNALAGSATAAAASALNARQRPPVGGGVAGAGAVGPSLRLPPISASLPALRRYSCTSIDLASDATEVTPVPPRAFAGDNVGRREHVSIANEISAKANRALTDATRALGLHDFQSRVLSDSRNSDRTDTSSVQAAAHGAQTARIARSVKKSVAAIARIFDRTASGTSDDGTSSSASNNIFTTHGVPLKPSATARGIPGPSVRASLAPAASNDSLPPRPPRRQTLSPTPQHPNPAAPTTAARADARTGNNNSKKRSPTGSQTAPRSESGGGEFDQFVRSQKALMLAGGVEGMARMRRETVERQAETKEALQDLFAGLAEVTHIMRGGPGLAVSLGDLRGQRRLSPEAIAAAAALGITGLASAGRDSPARDDGASGAAAAQAAASDGAGGGNSPAVKDLKLLARGTTNEALLGVGALDPGSVEGRLAAALLTARSDATGAAAAAANVPAHRTRFGSKFISDVFIAQTGGQPARREVRERMKATRDKMLQDEPRKRAALVKGYLKQVRLNNDRIQELKLLGDKWSSMTAGSRSACCDDDDELRSVVLPTAREEIIEDATSTAFLTQPAGAIDFKREALAVMGPSMKDLARQKAKELGRLPPGVEEGDLQSESSSVAEKRRDDEATLAAIQAGMQLPRGAPVFLTMVPRSVAGGIGVTQFISVASHDRALVREQHRAEDRMLRGEPRVKEVVPVLAKPLHNTAEHFEQAKQRRVEEGEQRAAAIRRAIAKREKAVTSTGANASTVVKHFSVWIVHAMATRRWANAIASRWDPFENKPEREQAAFHPPYTPQRLKELGTASELIQRHMFRFRVRQYFIQRRTAAFIVLAAMRHVVRHMRWRWAVHQFIARTSVVRTAIMRRRARRLDRLWFWFFQWRQHEPHLLRLANLYRDAEVRDAIGAGVMAARLRDRMPVVTSAAQTDRGLLSLRNKLRDVHRLETKYGSPLIRAAVQLVEFLQRSAEEGIAPAGRLVPTPTERVQKVMHDVYQLRKAQLRRDMHTYIKDKRTDAMLQRAFKSHDAHAATAEHSVGAAGNISSNNLARGASGAGSGRGGSRNTGAASLIDMQQLPNLPLLLPYEEVLHQIVERQQDAALLNRGESIARAESASFGGITTEASVFFDDPADDDAAAAQLMLGGSSNAPTSAALQRAASLRARRLQGAGAASMRAGPGGLGGPSSSAIPAAAASTTSITVDGGSFRMGASPAAGGSPRAGGATRTASFARSRSFVGTPGNGGGSPQAQAPTSPLLSVSGGGGGSPASRRPSMYRTSTGTALG